MAILTHKRHGKKALNFHYQKDGVIVTPLMLLFEHMHGKLLTYCGYRYGSKLFILVII